MFLTDDLLTTDEAAERQTWRDPLRRLAALDAEVAERWLVTARLPCSRFRELVPPGFLEAQTVGGTLVLTLCAVRIRHAAPAWAPLHLGPASMNCALRIACRDRRDGSPCAWVSHRYTSSALAPALAGLGLPHIAGGLIERGGPDRLDLAAGEGLVRAQIAPGGGPDPTLFADAGALAAFSAPARRYSPGRIAGRWTAIDLDKLADDRLVHLAGWEGWLRTPWGDCTIDGVYRAVDGRYRWIFRGEVDDDGDPL